MRLSVNIFLFLASLWLAVSVAVAGVRPRNVGPVILDLGSLPPAPVPSGDPGSSVMHGDVQTLPRVVEPSDTIKSDPESIVVKATYPGHSQPLGALVLTINMQIEPAVDNQASLLSTPPAPDAPLLVSYYHPSLAGDRALLKPSVETLPSPADPAEAPAVETGAETGTISNSKSMTEPKTEPETEPKSEPMSDAPLSRLRAVVIWIWRFLFLIGFGALFLLFFRRRRVGKTVSPPPPGAIPELDSSQDFLLSRILRVTGVNHVSVKDSLSLMTAKPRTIAPPETGSKAFGLIEPGAGRPASPVGAPMPDQDRKERQAPL